MNRNISKAFKRTGKGGKSARASPTPHHASLEERSVRFIGLGVRDFLARPRKRECMEAAVNGA